MIGLSCKILAVVPVAESSSVPSSLDFDFVTLGLVALLAAPFPFLPPPVVYVRPVSVVSSICFLKYKEVRVQER